MGGIVVMVLGMFFLTGPSKAYVQDDISIFLHLVLNGDTGSKKNHSYTNPHRYSTSDYVLLMCQKMRFHVIIRYLNIAKVEQPFVR